MRAAPVAALFAVACGSTTPDIPPPLPLPSASASATPVPPGVLPATAPGRVGLGTPRPEPLSLTLIPVQGADAVLAVHDYPGAPAAFVQRVGPDGALGPVITLPRAHVAGAFALRDGETSIATTEDDKLCVTTVRGDETTGRGCNDARPDVLATIGGRILALAAEEPEKDEDEATKKKPKRPPPAPSKKRKPKREPSAVEKLFSSGREREVMATWVAADGSAPAPAEKTGVRFTEPMAGMKLIGAGSRRERVDLAFYEKGKARGKEKRGTIGVAALDEAGLLVEGSRKSFGESKLAAGYLTDHVDPTLVTFGEGSLLLAQRGPRGKCDVTVSAPFVMQMIPDDDDCAIEPRRFFRLAQQKRKKGSPDPGPRPSGVARGAIARATGQPAWEAGRVTLTTTRAFALDADGIVSWSEGGAPERSKRPLVADRTRIFGGAIARDGSAIVHTSDGLVEVEADGRTQLLGRAEPRGVGGLDRPDVAAVERRLAVDVGGAWVQAVGELRRLTPELGPASRDIHPDAAVVVGGSAAGLFLEVTGSMLVVSRLSPDGSLTELSRLASPVAAGLDAVERPGGGAIVAGRERTGDRAWLTFALDAAGKIVAIHRGKLSSVLRGRAQLVAHPSGALLVGDDRLHVVWLDAQGALLAEAAWPRETSGAVCHDGRPMPKVVPSLKPGLFVTSSAAAYEGTCMSTFGFDAGGAFRWLGSTAATIHTRAELGVDGTHATTPDPSPLRSLSPAPVPAPAASSGRACPGEMVLVSGDLCVDRHESTLLDRNRGRYASPDFPPTPAAANGAFGDWVTRRERLGDVFARAFPVPVLPGWQVESAPSLVALARAGVRPNGYVSGAVARSVCAATGKRLCTLEEWRRACRGEAGLLFPYGASYVQGTCNVNGPVHPAATLHDNASVGHLDPRLNRLEASGETVLRPTGETPGCASRWGDDAIYDMVGNVDEWVDEKSGAFAGGFYARSTTNGCEALVSSHPESYFDYSTGVRCCKDAR